MRHLTISEAASATGLTEKALRSRIERGTLRTVRRDGRVRILEPDLVRAGLLAADLDVSSPDEEPGEVSEEGTGQVPRRGGNRIAVQTLDARELVHVIAAQAEELGRLRLLTEQAESARVRLEQEQAEADRLRAEVLELRARLAAAEAVEQPPPIPLPPVDAPRRGILARLLGG